MSEVYAKPVGITLIADPKVVQIQVRENNDPFINLIDQDQISFGPSPEIPNNTDYTFLRQAVYMKLLQAQKLLPPGIKFKIYEGYRSLKLQKLLFDNRYNYEKNAHPEWSREDLFHETIKLVSPVKTLDGTPNIPPHSTGGAFDIYLIDANGQDLDMGIHPADWLEDTKGLLSQTDSKQISHQAQKNRATMSAALRAVGFVNYPTEFWHWSYGDKYWAYIKGKEYAIYSSRQ